MSFVYRFFNQNKEIIYVGITKDISRRLNQQHFTKNGHLPKKCYEECVYVDYTNVKSENESRIYELFLISKYTPMYNSVFSNGGELSFKLPDLRWIKWDLKSNKNTVLKGDERVGKELMIESKNILESIETMKIFEFAKFIDEKDRKRFLLVLNYMEDYANRISEIGNFYFPESN